MTEIRTDDLGFGNLKLLQDPSEFCYGVDAVILADFAASICGGFRYAADLGTGTGVIPFILHHKAGSGDSRCFGLDFNEDSVGLARESSRLNGLCEQIHFGCGDIAELAGCGSAKAFAEDSVWQGAMENGGFDVVTSNPPYMNDAHGIKNPGDAKAIARHEVLCNLEDVVREGAKVLRPGGRYRHRKS